MSSRIVRTTSTGWPAGSVINVNFPPVEPQEVRGVEVTAQGARDQHHLHFQRRSDLRGRDYYWLGFQGVVSAPPPGVDLHAVQSGRISVTPLHIDMTDRSALGALQSALADGAGA